MAGGKSFFTKGASQTSPSPEEISAFLGKETVFQGKMTFQGIFRLEGKFEGEIFESGTLIIGQSGVVKGKIEAQTVVIHGWVEADIQVKERVEIHSVGKLYGNLLTPTLIIDEGGIFEGHCRMEKSRNKEDDLHLLSHKEDYPASFSTQALPEKEKETSSVGRRGLPLGEDGSEKNGSR
jgi:cytoskeletal protein CcmA (bactofilin family)